MEEILRVLRKHSRECIKLDLEILLPASGFREVDVQVVQSSRHREGLGVPESVGTTLKDLVPSLRKSIIEFGVK